MFVVSNGSLILCTKIFTSVWPLCQRPFLWSATVVNIYRLYKCNFYYYLSMVSEFYLLTAGSYHEKKWTCSSTCKTHSLRAATTPRTILFPWGERCWMECVFNLSWLKSFFHDARQEWRVLGLRVKSSLFLCLPFTECVRHSKQMLLMTAESCYFPTFHLVCLSTK